MSKAQSSDSESLDEKIRRIRKRNEEIEKRRMEVEADKETAAKLNALVQLNAPTEDWPLPRSFSPEDERQSRGPGTHQEREKGRGTRNITFGDTVSEANRPPPDPAYRFLADAERDPLPQKNVYRSQQRSRGGGRGMTRGRGRNSKFRPEREPGGQVTHMYEAWRAERNRIDEERIRRQRTAQGHWRREWDSQKCEDNWQAPRGERTRKQNAGTDRGYANPPSGAVFTDPKKRLPEEQREEIVNSSKSLMRKHIATVGSQPQHAAAEGPWQGGGRCRRRGGLGAPNPAAGAENIAHDGTATQAAAASQQTYGNNAGQQAPVPAPEHAEEGAGGSTPKQSDDLAVEAVQEKANGTSQSTVLLLSEECYIEPSVSETVDSLQSPQTYTSATGDRGTELNLEFEGTSSRHETKSDAAGVTDSADDVEKI